MFSCGKVGLRNVPVFVLVHEVQRACQYLQLLFIAHNDLLKYCKWSIKVGTALI